MVEFAYTSYSSNKHPIWEKEISQLVRDTIVSKIWRGRTADHQTVVTIEVAD